MMPENPEQLRAFMRGETDDPGVVRAVRGGTRFPVVQETVMPDGSLIVEGEVDGRRIVGAVLPGVGVVDLDTAPAVDPATNPYVELFAEGGWTVADRAPQ